MKSRGDPAPSDIQEMREYGWTSIDGEWFMPLRWGVVFSHVFVEGEDGKVRSTRVECGLTLPEAWAFHCLFAIRDGTPEQGFFVKRRS
jgi:hypothetical protein